MQDNRANLPTGEFGTDIILIVFMEISLVGDFVCSLDCGVQKCLLMVFLKLLLVLCLDHPQLLDVK
jgi:hypothetical protein